MGMANGDRLTFNNASVSQPRQPRGVKEGGQFARSLNSEAVVDLVAGLEETRRQASSYIRRYGLFNKNLDGYIDADDLMQDAAVEYLLAHGRERTPEMGPLPTALIAKRAITHHLSSGDHKSYTASKLFGDERRNEETRLGRDLTPKEESELAEKVRLSIPAHSRPSADYYRSRVPRRPLDDVRFAGGANAETRSVDRVSFDREDPVINTDDFAEGSIGDRANALKMVGEQVGARALAWDAIAEHAGAPLTCSTPIGKRAAIRARAEVMEAGGALECARRFLDSGETSPSLFAPFGDIDDDGRYAACEVLVKYPDYAADLWKTALSQVEGRAVTK